MSTTPLAREIAVREHDLGWHWGKKYTGRCSLCNSAWRRERARTHRQVWVPR